MPPQVNVIRPDGSVVSATPEEAKKLQVLGYRIESPEEEIGRIAETEEKRFYSTPSQKLATAGEGLLSGLTIGGSDFVLDSERSRGRAEHNPGTRMATQLVGAIAPAIVSGGAGGIGAAARLTPAGALAAGSATIGRAATAGRVAGTAIAAGIEGGVTAAGTEAGRAHLAGDPVTAESLIAAAGWGSLLGAGVGAGAAAFGRGAEKLGARLNDEKRLAKLEELASAPTPGKVLPKEAFEPLYNSVDDLTRAARKAVDDVDGAMKASKGAIKNAETAMKAADGNLKALARLKKVHDDILDTAGPTGTGQQFTPEGSAVRKSVLASYKKAQRAVDNGDPVEVQKAFDEYRASLEGANKTFGFTEFPVPTAGSNPLAMGAAAAQEEAAKLSAKALEDVTGLRSALKVLDGMPRGPQEFLAMTPQKAERIFAGIDQALKHGGQEIDAIRQGVVAAADNLAAASGLTTQAADPVGKLREAWTVLREANTKRAIMKANKAVARTQTAGKDKPSFLTSVLSQAAARKASSVTRGLGGGAFSSSAAYQSARRLVGNLGAYLTGGPAGLAAEVTGVRAAVQQVMRQAVADYGPRASRVIKRASPHIGAMNIRLDGSEDDEGGSKADQFKRRSQEIRNVLPIARDALYRSVEPLQVEGEGDFAAVLHEGLSKMIDIVGTYLPKDPGDQFSRGRSIWKPSDVEMLQFERKYEVFQDPLGFIAAAMATGQVTPEGAQALRELYPALYDEMRFGMMERLADDSFAESLSYNDQVGLSVMLDLDLHASLRPEWIASQQAMFAQREAPTPTQGSGGGGGRPPGPAGPPTPPTKAQQLTER